MRAFRWLVRVCSFLFLVFQVASLVGEPWAAALLIPDRVNLVVWGIVLLGMALGWMWEGSGGFVVLVAFIVQVALYPDILKIHTMWLAPAIGALFIISWAMSEGGVSR
jgi:hypothetical protein